MAATDRFRNWFITTLVYDVESTDTTIVINKALDVTQGRLIINPNSEDKEIVKITNVTSVTGGTQLTVERGDDGTLPRHHYAETVVVMNVTAGDLNDLYEEVQGQLVPTGGLTGQALVKASDDDGDTTWGEGGGGASVYVGDTPPPDPGEGDLWVDTTEVVDPTVLAVLKTIYDVGSYYMSDDPTSPATKWGFGTWVQLKDRILIGVGDDPDWDEAGKVYGAKTHTLTTAEMPSHRHGVSPYKALISGRTGTAGSFTSNDGGTVNYTEYTGGGDPHNNMPPVYATYIWRRTA